MFNPFFMFRISSLSFYFKFVIEAEIWTYYELLSLWISHIIQSFFFLCKWSSKSDTKLLNDILYACLHAVKCTWLYFSSNYYVNVSMMGMLKYMCKYSYFTYGEASVIYFEGLSQNDISRGLDSDIYMRIPIYNDLYIHLSIYLSG